jgi:hypothetical protein
LSDVGIRRDDVPTSSGVTLMVIIVAIILTGLLLAGIVWLNVEHQRVLKGMTPEQLRAYKEEEKYQAQQW